MHHQPCAWRSHGGYEGRITVHTCGSVLGLFHTGAGFPFSQAAPRWWGSKTLIIGWEARNLCAVTRPNLCFFVYWLTEQKKIRTLVVSQSIPVTGTVRWFDHWRISPWVKTFWNHLNLLPVIVPAPPLSLWLSASTSSIPFKYALWFPSCGL